MYYSEEGCAQGDPLGPFLWAIGYHEALLRQQAAHPDTLIYAYLDDTYACDEPLQAVACMDTGAAVTLEMCNVASNTKKQCVWSPGGAAALAVLAPRISLKGTPDALPVDYDTTCPPRLRSRRAATREACCRASKSLAPSSARTSGAPSSCASA